MGHSLRRWRHHPQWSLVVTFRAAYWQRLGGSFGSAP
jgi:hypothetical protein